MEKPGNKEYWMQLHSNPELRGSLAPEIRQSWDRSYQYGVSPNLRSLPLCSGSELQDQPNLGYMLDVARPIVKQMQPFLADDHAILLLSDQSSVLDVIAQDKVIERLERYGVREGASLAEKVAGTNAVALGTVLAKPISLVSHEHFCKFFIDYGCSFAPIIDRQKIVGGIAIAGPADTFDRSTLGMATIVSHSIVIRISVQRWTYMIDKYITEGVLWLNKQNRIVYMSRPCHIILKYPEQPTAYNLPLEKIIDRRKPENKYFWGIMDQNQTVSDESMVIMVGKESINCNTSISFFESSDGTWSGKVIVIQAMERINRLIRNYSGNRARLTFNDIIGSNPGFLSAVNKARLSAASFSNILLLGESGTGKDVLAQAIHNESPKKSGPFIAINCAALPRELIASELFGYDEGAFTGAKRGGNMGKFELAHQGSILLDEIGDMPLDLQAMLLRVIEERCIVRLGGNRPIPVNVRIIAATNKNLDAELERNAFRRDLYYRLGVIRIVIPPLRQRPDDIEALSKHFIQVICRRINIPVKTLSPEALDIFKEYSWPGNVRELQNVLEGAVQWSSDPVITRNLIEQLLPSMGSPKNSDTVFMCEQEEPSEKQLIRSYLEKFDYNKSKTAKAMGISRKTLYIKLKAYGLPAQA